MKHIVFILSGYYPYSSAVGTCVQNVAFCLKDHYHVTILAEKNRYGQIDEDFYNGCRVLRVCTRLVKCRLFVEDRKNSAKNFITRMMYSVALLFLRTLKYLKAVIMPQNVDYCLCGEYEDALSRIHSAMPIDVLIPVCIPFETMTAAFKYCNKLHVPPNVIAYFLDPFSDNVALHRTERNQKIKYARHLQLERNILDISNHVIIMKHLETHFCQEFPEYADKISVLEHPMLHADCFEFCEKGTGTQMQTLTYAGSFRQGIREPDFMLRVLVQLNLPLECNIYAFGNCSKVLLEYAQRYPCLIHYHGGVAKDTADRAIARSDYIISVGNRNANQSPSKIFECLATGKPIIHFYYYKQDSVITILQRYPNALCLPISHGFAEETVKQLRKFLVKKHETMAIEEVRRLFTDALPETTANAISEYIEHK